MSKTGFLFRTEIQDTSQISPTDKNTYFFVYEYITVNMLIFVEIITGVFLDPKNGMVVFLQCLVIVTTTIFKEQQSVC